MAVPNYSYSSPISVLFGLLFTLAQIPGTSADLVSGPATNYVILSGPLPVQYSIDYILEGNYLSLYKQGSVTEIAKQNLQLVSAGIAQFPCDIIVSPGTYEVRLFNSTRHQLSSSHEFSAVWPRFNLTIPKTHIAQEEPHVELQASFINTRITCRAQTPATLFYLEVEFSEEESFSASSVVHQELNVYLRDLNGASKSFRCEVFDRAGFYRINLKKPENVHLEKSNIMSVTWGDNYYKLSSTQDSVFPCIDKLMIDYTRPKCVVKEDNIHMYATKNGRGEGQLEYLYEAKAEVGASSVSFRCDDIRQYQWNNHATAFCFRYQTVASNQAVTNHNLFCLPTNSSVGLPVDGQWSSWSNWTKCSGNCEWGKQSRYRYCNSPTPAHGGQFCEGGVSVEWGKCRSTCKPAVTVAVSITNRPVHKVPKCWCGCTLSDTSGLLIPGRDCRQTSDYRVHIVWLIQAAPDEYIQLNITEFGWSLASQMLKIRDGSSFNDQLLVELKGNDDISAYSVTSSGSYLHIEFMSNEQVPVQTDLFIAKYNVIGLEQQSQSPLVAVGPEAEEAWKTPMMIVAGIVAGVLFVTIVIAIFIKCRQLRRAKLTRQNPDSSPNHVILQVQDGEYTNFGDITASTVPTVPNPRRVGESSRSNNPEAMYTKQCETNNTAGRHKSNNRSDRKKNRNNSGFTFTIQPDNRKAGASRDVRPKEIRDAKHYDNLAASYGVPSNSRKSNGAPPQHHRHMKKHRHASRNKIYLQDISEDLPDLPDPYHVKPEDFIHDIDVLHHRSDDRHSKHYKDMIVDTHTPVYSVDKHNTNITLDSIAPVYSTKRANKGVPISKKPIKQKRLKKRRHKVKHSDYQDPEEVDRLLNSLPVGADAPRYAPPIDPDSEYRALINQLSSTGSHNQSELVNTSAEVHPVPNTTPVENTSQELSPLASPNNPPPNNGHRSPCLDDGYNSLANTGSTQSNISAHSKEHVGVPKLNRIKETSRSETSCELSPRVTSKSPQRHSAEIMQGRRADTHSISVGMSPEQHLSNNQSQGGKELPPKATIKAEELELSHVTCPLLKPDGRSESDISSGLVDESPTVPPPLETSFNSNELSPRNGTLFTPPPSHFADNSVILDRSADFQSRNNNVNCLNDVPKHIVNTDSLQMSDSGNRSSNSVNNPECSPNRPRTAKLKSGSTYSNKERPVLVYGTKAKDGGMTQSTSTSDSYGYDDYLPPPTEDSSYPLLPKLSPSDELSSELNV